MKILQVLLITILFVIECAIGVDMVCADMSKPTGLNWQVGDCGSYQFAFDPDYANGAGRLVIGTAKNLTHKRGEPLFYVRDQSSVDLDKKCNDLGQSLIGKILKN